MSTYAASCFVAFGVSLLLGAVVLLHNREEPLNHAFFVGCAAFAAWSLAAFVLSLPSDTYQAERWARFLAYAAIPVGAVLVEISARTSGSPQRRSVTIALGIAVVLAGLNSADMLVSGVRINPLARAGAYWQVTPGPFGALLATYLVASAIVALLGLAKHASLSKGLVRARARYMSIATAALTLAMLHDVAAAASAVAAAPAHILISSRPWVPTAAAAWALVSAYALLRERFADLGAALRRTLVRSVTLVVLAVPFMYLVLEAEQAYAGSRYFRFSIVTLVTFAVAAFVVPPLRQAAHERLDRLLGARSTTHRRALLDFSKQATSFATAGEMIARARFELTSPFGLSTADVLVHDGRGGFHPADGWRFAGDSLDPGEIADMLAYFRHTHQPIVREEVDASRAGPPARRAAQALARAGAEAAFELRTTDSTEGILLLGGRSDGEPFSSEDVETMTILSNNLAAALGSSRLAADLEQSRLVIARSERLSAIGTLAAGLAHEIRNPLVSIRTFTQLLPERLDDPEFRNHFLTLTLSEVDRICALVNELLAFARPAPATLEKVDVGGCVERLCALLTSQAKSRGVSLTMTAVGDDIVATVDEDQVKQVVMNVVLNAIQACIDGGRVQVCCYHATSHDGLGISIEVVDNGCGIPEDAISRIFDPFFTTRTEGTGLGLAVAHRIVTAHGGSIDVTSRVGHGSRFVIRLPATVSGATETTIAEPQRLGSHG